MWSRERREVEGRGALRVGKSLLTTLI